MVEVRNGGVFAFAELLLSVVVQFPFSGRNSVLHQNS
jgi:hypothetical protein